MAIIANQNSRPITVKVASTCLLASVGLVVVKIVLGAHWENPLTYVAIPVVLSVPLLFVWFIFRGKNWARWIFLVLFALGLLLSIRDIQQPHSTVTLAFFFAQSVVQLVAAIALILPASNKWFKGDSRVA